MSCFPYVLRLRLDIKTGSVLDWKKIKILRSKLKASQICKNSTGLPRLGPFDRRGGDGSCVSIARSVSGSGNNLWERSWHTYMPVRGPAGDKECPILIPLLSFWIANSDVREGVGMLVV